MAKIFGAKLNALTITGCIVLIALLLVGVFSLINIGTKNDIVQPATIDDIKTINEERYRYEDSLMIVNNAKLLDSIRILNDERQTIDSFLFNFYNQTIYNYEKSINSVTYATDDELLRQWSKRYGR